jgi:predicted SAM-dependent methyltransferase
MVNIIKNLIKKILRLSSWQMYIFKNHSLRPPIHIPPKNEGLRIHIGPGVIDLKGWINIDGRPLEHIHLVTDNLSLKEFADGEIAEIYMCHILEHLSFAEVSELLINLHKKLQVNGIMRISVPDFSVISNIYNNHKDIELIKYPLMGGQDYSYNYHKAIFDFNSLKVLLKNSGYKGTTEWDANQDFGVDIGDWSSGKIKTPSGKQLISLNIKAFKA